MSCDFVRRMETAVFIRPYTRMIDCMNSFTRTEQPNGSLYDDNGNTAGYVNRAGEQISLQVCSQSLM